MPNIKSAKKRVKVNSVKALNNQMAKSELKTTLKKFAPPAQEQCVQQEEQDDYQAQRHGVSSGIEHRNRKLNLRFFFLYHLDIYRNVLTNAETVVY